MEFDLHTLIVSVDYLDNPVIRSEVSKDFQVTLKNPRLVNLDVEVSVRPPEGRVELILPKARLQG